ncbi:MAG: AAA family ATPase [Candidatus Omnitrophota bacterium]|nr:AAA family ATPase [Candidatus Omnitrophota bacterium]
MYEEYWKLQEKPFENTPDPHFLYYSQRHEEALSRMLYAIRERKGAAVLTGEYGSGKTLLSRVLLEELSNEKYQSALIFNPRLPPLELIKEIIYQLGRDVSSLSSKTGLLHSLNEILYKNRDDNKNTVIVVDEAQAIGEEGTFEELRLLLNFQLNDNFLLSLILLGQPELKKKVEEMPQLRQRLAVRYHLKALTGKETEEYIKHRVAVAGAKKQIFSEDALKKIYYFSAGIPRRINNICDMALMVGCGEEQDIIDKNIIEEVADDLEETPVEIEEKVGSMSNG